MVAAVAVVVGVLAVWLPLTSSGGGGGGGGEKGADTATLGRVDELPVRWSPPADPPDLPQGTPVGPATLVYCRADCAGSPILLTSGGRQYAVPGSVLGLSPDGRWLVSGPRDGAQVLRDLTGVGATALGDALAVKWSPDGRWCCWSRGIPRQ